MYVAVAVAVAVVVVVDEVILPFGFSRLQPAMSKWRQMSETWQVPLQVHVHRELLPTTKIGSEKIGHQEIDENS